MKNHLEELLAVLKAEFPLADIQVLKNGRGYRVSQKTNDAPSRPSKRFSPLLIELHEDFETSKISQLSASDIRKEMHSFMARKKSSFFPQSTDSRNQIHEEETWVFPAEC